MAVHRVFLLSPASSSGLRAQLLLREQAKFELAVRLRSAAGAPLGDVFQFASGLYFRGKLAYARAFENAPKAVAGAQVITPGRGLMPVDTRITRDDLIAFGAVPIDEDEPRYRRPLERDAKKLRRALPKGAQVVLLGSVASTKYTSVLLDIFGEDLHFPPDFVGRGDMSRGGLMLRCAESKTELRYAPVLGAVVHGKRPPKLPPKKRAA